MTSPVSTFSAGGSGQALASTRKRRGACVPRRNGTARRRGQEIARLPNGRTTVCCLNGARDLMELALPFTAPAGACKESFEVFVSKAIAERVARLQGEHKFPLPPGLSLLFPFTV